MFHLVKKLYISKNLLIEHFFSASKELGIIQRVQIYHISAIINQMSVLCDSLIKLKLVDIYL